MHFFNKDYSFKFPLCDWVHPQIFYKHVDAGPLLLQLLFNFSSFSYSLPVDIDPKSQLNRKPFELDKVEVRGTHLCLVLVLVLVLYFNLVKLIVNLVLWFVPKVNNQSSTLLLNHTIVGVLLPSLSYLNDAIVCLVAAEKNSTHKSLMADIAPLMMWHFCRFLLYRNEGW